MKLKDLMNDYIDKKITAIETIRTLSGMFQPKDAVDLLAVINQICRYELGDLPEDIFVSFYRG